MIQFMHGFRPQYEPEGAPAGEPTPQVPAATSQAPAATPQPQEHNEGDPYAGWWASQLPKDMREGPHKDAILALKGKGIGDVLGEYFTSKTTLDRAIVPPGKDAKPEEVKAFLAKMDIPEAPDGYGFDPKSVEDADGKFTESAAKELHALGLTKKQGQGVFNLLSNLVKAGNQYKSDAAQQDAAGFEERLSAAVGEKAKETTEYYKQYLITMAGGSKEAGKAFIQKLKDKGLFYDVDFVVNAAAYHKAHTAEAPYIEGHNGGKGGTGKRLMGHSDQFESQYGNK